MNKIRFLKISWHCPFNSKSSEIYIRKIQWFEKFCTVASTVGGEMGKGPPHWVGGLKIAEVTRSISEILDSSPPPFFTGISPPNIALLPGFCEENPSGTHVTLPHGHVERIVARLVHRRVVDAVVEQHAGDLRQIEFGRQMETGLAAQSPFLHMRLAWEKVYNI